MTDIALAVDRALTPPVLYRDASNYERLVATWFDERPVPTEAELDAAWAEIQTELTQEETRAAQRILNMAEIVGDKADSAIAVIDADLTTLGGTPTNAQVVNIITRSLQREKQEIRALRDTIVTMAAALGILIEGA